MTRHSLFAAAALALLVAGCSRGNADKGQPSEQQRSDLDDAAKMVDGNQSYDPQTVELPDDSLTVNDSEARATLNGAAPGNAAPGNAAPGNAAVAPAPAPVPANGVAANRSNPARR